MSNDIMLNVRMNPTLKDHGCAVLDRHGVSVSTFIRTAFEYLEKNQQLPPELFAASESAGQARRKLLRSAAGSFSVEPGFDFCVARDEYRAHRAEKFQEGTRV